ncbi:hypothetical protein [Streptomyces beigongshangae]|nr:hypothetical protein [Streptomyces sp. REN17]
MESPLSFLSFLSFPSLAHSPATGAPPRDPLAVADVRREARSA